MDMFLLNNPSSVCVTSCICQFKNSLTDTFQQEWYGTLSNSPVLEMYRVFKPTIRIRTIIWICYQGILRFHFVKLRTFCTPIKNTNREVYPKQYSTQ